MGEAEITPPSQAPMPPLPQRISPHVTFQAPLSRHGRGPGLVLVLDHYAAIEPSEKHLDPPPLQKWAEEGFAVVQLLVPCNTAQDGEEFPLQKALDILRECKECEFDKGIGLISYITRTPYYVDEAVCQNPAIKALVSYSGRKFASLTATHQPPQLVHLPGPPIAHRRQSSTESVGISPPSVKTYRYEDAEKESGWVFPSDPNYHKRNAGIAHTRTLTFLKPLLGGPYFDLEAVWEEHTKYEFGERDVEKTMATMVDQPYVNHIPTMTGGIGKDRLTAFYTHHFVFSNPPDTSLSLVSRTVGIDRVIDEFVFSLTHTSHIPWLLPGIPPTGQRLSIPFTSVVALRGDRLCHEHISWDHATALKQCGLLPEYVPFPYEVEKGICPEGKRLEVRLPVVGEEGSRKLVDEGAEESNGLMGEHWRVVDA